MLDDGSEVQLEPKDFGMNGWESLRVLQPAIREGNLATVRQLAQFYEDRHGEGIVVLRIEREEVALSADGWQTVASETEAAIDLSEAD